jgi:predicted secreted acid phosphatase
MENKPKAIIIDIDGTVADAHHRLHLIEKKLPDGDAFYDLMVDYTPLVDNYEKIKQFIASHPDELAYIFVTGRRDTHKIITIEWLKKHGFIHPTLLLMREDGDHRPDTEVKQEIFKTVIEPFYDVVMAFDDRPRILRMWESLGIPTTDMGDGVDF